MNERTKSRFEVVVTSYGRNKNLDEEIKNQEKAENSPSYRCAAITNNSKISKNGPVQEKVHLRLKNFKTQNWQFDVQKQIREWGVEEGVDLRTAPHSKNLSSIQFQGLEYLETTKP